MPQRALCRGMEVLPSKWHPKPPELYASRRPFDETLCDKRTRHAVLWWLPMSPTRRRDRKGRSQSHAQPTVAKNATVRTNLARSFCSIFKSLAWASEANRIGIHDAKSQRVRCCRRSNTHSKLISTFPCCIESP